MTIRIERDGSTFAELAVEDIRVHACTEEEYSFGLGYAVVSEDSLGVRRRYEFPDGSALIWGR